EVYRFWRHLENHPRFMQHLESVVSTNGTRSHWVAKVPLPAPIEWDADIVVERENTLLSWRCLLGVDLGNAGTIRFQELQLIAALRCEVAPHLTVVTSTSAQSGVAVPVPDALAASVVPSETAVHETTGVRASSSNGR